ncbi:hypothetical protein RQP46_002591 [Phenoliferia psychrophenolica]
MSSSSSTTTDTFADKAQGTFKLPPQSLFIADIFSVTGKVVLITGGGTGMGRGMALALATNGAKVYITGRRMEKLEEVVAESKDFAGTIIAIKGDIADLAGVNALYEEVQKLENHLDVLNVGIYRMGSTTMAPNDPASVQKDLLSAKWEDFTDQTSVNVASLYFVTATFIPLLQKSSSPQVINNTSAMGVSGGVSGSLSYSASKAMAINVTKALAGRLIPLHIRVNSIQTWLYPSEISGGVEGIMSAPFFKPILNRIPAGRCGFPENLAGVILFLASKASEYSNGLAMNLDGGWLLGESNAPCLPDPIPFPKA